jgi:hypothetical protein
MHGKTTIKTAIPSLMNRAAFYDATHRTLTHRYQRVRENCRLILQNTRPFCPKRKVSSRPSETLVFIYESTRRPIAEGINFIVSTVKIPVLVFSLAV